ncbi:MAG TPA: hypothetical protein VMZ53_20795 [Kofleriaceae bacterium]|nr:hypothetical protein [Kofleriaceae bacterium]
MRSAALAFVVVALVACSNKKSGPPPRCVVKVTLPALDADAAKAPACSATIIAPESTSYADVIAAMDTLAAKGFTDFGIGAVTFNLPAPPKSVPASRTTNEGKIIGRIELADRAPSIVIGKTGEVSVGGNLVGNMSVPGGGKLDAALTAALPKPGPDAVIIITAHASITYAAIERAAKAAAKAGYAGMLFSILMS